MARCQHRGDQNARGKQRGEPQEEATRDEGVGDGDLRRSSCCCRPQCFNPPDLQRSTARAMGGPPLERAKLVSSQSFAARGPIQPGPAGAVAQRGLRTLAEQRGVT